MTATTEESLAAIADGARFVADDGTGPTTWVRRLGTAIQVVPNSGVEVPMDRFTTWNVVYPIPETVIPADGGVGRIQELEAQVDDLQRAVERARSDANTHRHDWSRFRYQVREAIVGNDYDLSERDGKNELLSDLGLEEISNEITWEMRITVRGTATCNDRNADDVDTSFMDASTLDSDISEAIRRMRLLDSDFDDVEIDDVSVSVEDVEAR